MTAATHRSTLLDEAAPHATGPLVAALEGRAGIFEMTAVAEQAVLRPVDAGAWGHGLRAALAARIARLHGEEALAARYRAMAGDDPSAALADPAQGGRPQEEPQEEMAASLAAAVAFVDRVATRPSAVSAEDVAGLQAAGVGDADIVRLCEIVAFHAYQNRVAAGLRLMQGAAS